MTFPIGTEYLEKRGKLPPRLCRVIDIHKTYNAAGQLVKTRYVCEHEFCGQTVVQYDVVAFTIAKALNCPEPESSIMTLFEYERIRDMARLEYEKAVIPVRAKYGVTDPRPGDKRRYLSPAQEAYLRETASARAAFFDVVAPAKAALKRSLADERALTLSQRSIARALNMPEPE